MFDLWGRNKADVPSFGSFYFAAEKLRAHAGGKTKRAGPVLSPGQEDF
jgi:hypothetical protein